MILLTFDIDLCIVLYSVIWCSIVLYGVQLYSIVLYCILLCYIVLYGVQLCYILFKCVQLCYMVLNCVQLCYMVFKCVELCYMVLNCVQLYCYALSELLKTKFVMEKERLLLEHDQEKSAYQKLLSDFHHLEARSDQLEAELTRSRGVTHKVATLLLLHTTCVV